ncbi:hypothetical protein [Streptomyces sp. PSKA30]|uniref:hypothetical protein n=1 Tax=Streptomyces sp. PSKA30 TaxID=2874597 RepID=UPI0027E0A5CA|nr:hypothetical protein [Streptomyces sp. PSKA30]
MIASAQLGVGLMTAAIGTPYFLHLLVRREHQGGAGSVVSVSGTLGRGGSMR